MQAQQEFQTDYFLIKGLWYSVIRNATVINKTFVFRSLFRFL